MKPYRRILVATDFSPSAERAFPIARAFAELHAATVVLAHAFDTATLAYDGPAPRAIPPSMLVEGEVEARLQEALATAAATHFAGLAHVETRLRLDASPPDALVEIARRDAIDLIVLATHGRTGLESMLIGSVAERVVRHAPCSVLAVPIKGPERRGQARHLLVGTDLSPASEPAVAAASAHARATSARTTLLHARQPIPWVGTPAAGARPASAEGSSGAPAAQLERTALHHFQGLEVETAIVEAENAAVALCDEAERRGVDLVLVASHGRTGLARMLLGSVAEKTVRHAACPVWVVRPRTPS